MLKMVVCISGGGTNLGAIMKALEEQQIKQTKIVGVFSNNPNAYGLQRAKDAGLDTCCLSPKTFETRELFNHAFLEAVDSWKPDLIVLAGFLVNIPTELIDKYPNRIMNIHPSLIPAFCGVGYYGLKVHEGVLSRGVKVTGATVHFVDAGCDTGPIILQKAVEVLPSDTPKSLQQRVMEEAEWVILPQAIGLFAENKIQVLEHKVIIEA